jgi:hypothetical protein
MIKRSWRLFLGLAIGGGLGYALVLLAQPARRRPARRWHTLYQATPEQREEQRTA